MIVEATGSPTSAYWMRSTISNCSVTIQPFALAIVYYPSANTTTKPTTTAWSDLTDQCANDPLSSTVPIYPITPTPDPATTITLAVGVFINSTGHLLWTINKSSFRADYNAPILLLSNAGNDSYPYDPEWNVYNTGNATSIRLVVENTTPVAHPMHLHGHNMYVLNEGLGTWDGSSVVNSENPQRRDVQLLQPDGYIVVQYDGDNPGVWPFHCHIAWHVSAGLYVNFMVCLPIWLIQAFLPLLYRLGAAKRSESMMANACPRNNPPTSRRCICRPKASRRVWIGRLLRMSRS